MLVVLGILPSGEMKPTKVFRSTCTVLHAVFVFETPKRCAPNLNPPLQALKAEFPFIKQLCKAPFAVFSRFQVA